MIYLLSNQKNEMQKLISIFRVVLFVYAITLTSCGYPSTEESACSDNEVVKLDDKSCCTSNELDPKEASGEIVDTLSSLGR